MGLGVSRASFPYPYNGDPPMCKICNQPMKVYRPEESLGCAFECDPFDCRDNLRARLDKVIAEAPLITAPLDPKLRINDLIHFGVQNTAAIQDLTTRTEKLEQSLVKTDALRLEMTAHHRATANDLLRVSTQLDGTNKRITSLADAELKICAEQRRLQEQQSSLAEQVTRELADFRKQAGGIHIAVATPPRIRQPYCCEPDCDGCP